ncbi:MAG: ABC transporter ATP-binding protein [Acidobacteriia bacterium]|nr:ABC transporter ATP-binding protein [Terriglobia bacterium]
MAELRVRVDGLGKRYRLVQRPPYRTLRDAVASRFTHPFRGADRRAGEASSFWALRGVSFEVQEGEVVGIVGRNGAGKSTLLKILSRITEPTEGRAEIRGRVGSLLEVGTGFHPELTGRENVFLNGAILGMRKIEIDRCFEEIVAFAEVERFLDTPVKHYSSGMYMRLAFAVAAHLESEILLVDEVLAVGDAQFQRKCLGKMTEVAHAGRTVLFVSHSMKAVRHLCGRALWIAGGGLRRSGPTGEVVEAYLRDAESVPGAATVDDRIARLPADPDFRLLGVAVLQGGVGTTILRSDLPVNVRVTYDVLHPVRELRVYFDVVDEQDDILIRSFHDEHEEFVREIAPGRYTSTATLPADLLASRTYRLVVHAGIHNRRSCTGAGVPVDLTVQAAGGINRAYPGDTVRAKLQPSIAWQTRTEG